MSTKRDVERLHATIADLLAVLEEMPDIIRDCDGGNAETTTGWASEELLDLWMRMKTVTAKARDINSGFTEQAEGY